jgi:endoglucanase
MIGDTRTRRHRDLRWLLFLTTALLVGSLLLGLLRTPQGARADGAGYWKTSGSKIVDGAGVQVRITGINWFGFETETAAPHGLHVRGYKEILDQIKTLGYNTIRLPWSNQFMTATTPSGIDYGKNPDLSGLTPLQVMDKIIDYAGKIGLRIFLDNHRSINTGQSPLWYIQGDPTYTEERWINDWKTLAARYKSTTYISNPTMVIGADLRNEPHGACWGCGDVATDWRLAAQRAGNAILSVNADWLIIVEGVGEGAGEKYWWGGYLRPAASYPVVLTVPNRVVYQAHSYPLSIWPSPGHPWFFAANYPNNLDCVWDYYWGWIRNGTTCTTGNADFSGTETRTQIAGWQPAPLLLGEFGSKLATLKDQQWLDAMTSYLGTGVTGIHWTFWCFNPNSGDTGGIVSDDWRTVINSKQDKLAMIQAPLQPAGATATPAAPPTATITPPAVATATTMPATSGLKVQYRVGDADPVNNTMNPHLQVLNTSGSAVALSGLKLRYWFLGEGQKNSLYNLDWAQVGNGNVTGSVVKLTNSLSGADTYVEIGFTSGAGSLAANTGNSGPIQLRIYKEDYSNYDEKNDYSYDGTKTSYADWNKVTLYTGSTLSWGMDPGGATSGAQPTATFPVGTPKPTATNTPVVAATNTPTPARTSTSLPQATTVSSGLKVQYKVGDPTGPLDNAAKPHFMIFNMGGSSVALSGLKIRYYFTKDNATGFQTPICDYAGVGCGNLSGSIVGMTAVTGADSYLEVAFTSGAGSIAAGGNTGDIQMRFSKSDWSNITETGDYSYDSTKTAYADWTKVTLYSGAALVWGVAP